MTKVHQLRRKTVVIVGFQFAGQRAQRILSAEFDVVLVDSKGYFEFTPSILKCLVDPNKAARFIVPYGANIVVGVATRVEFNGESGGQLHLDDGRTLQFDFLLLCCGSGYASPIKADPSRQTMATERLAAVHAAHSQLHASGKVCIVGGGAVGVELAAEIAGKYGQSKHVTLITSASRLLERMSPKAGATAANWLQRHGVQIFLQERVVSQMPEPGQHNPGGASVTTSSGRVIDCDVLYKCTSGQPNTGLVCTFLGPGSTSAATSSNRGIPVTSTLQVQGLPPCVFAAGDCTNTGEEKTALAADLSAKLAAENISRMAKGRQLLRYPVDVCHGRTSLPVVEVISLYRYNGVMQFNTLVLHGWLAAAAKFIVETFAVASAKRQWWGAVLWGVMEAVTVWLGCWLFRQ